MFLHILFRTLPKPLFEIIAEIASFRITYHISDFGNIQLVLDKQLCGSFQSEILMNPITVMPVSAFIFLYRLEWLIAIVLAI